MQRNSKPAGMLNKLCDEYTMATGPSLTAKCVHQPFSREQCWQPEYTWQQWFGGDVCGWRLLLSNPKGPTGNGKTSLIPSRPLLKAHYTQTISGEPSCRLTRLRSASAASRWKHIRRWTFDPASLRLPITPSRGAYRSFPDRHLGKELPRYGPKRVVC